MSDYRPYAGIGSRQCPEEVLDLFRSLGSVLYELGYKLRTGGAPGADQAFYFGARLKDDEPEVYLPWPNFEGYSYRMATLSKPQPEAFEIAARYHPRWNQISDGVKKLIARNAHQILGPDVTKPDASRFVVCWTPGGKGGGGTGQAIRHAKDLSIPVYDFGSLDPQKMWTRLMEELDD